jgi:predicted transcriptional regulator
MRKSKLELYEEILASLTIKPKSIDEIAYQCKMDCVLLNQRIEFLVKQNILEEKTIDKKRQYALTRRGSTVFKTLVVVKQLEKLQTSTQKIPKHHLFHLVPFQNSEKERIKPA